MIWGCNMEPYNPNKPFLEFKFDKEKAKDELRNTIPGLRALEYYHQNPDSSITNSLDILAEDFVPFYATSKYGGKPSDYAKEAFLLGLPMKSPNGARSRVRIADGSSLINEITAHPRRKYYNIDNEVVAYKSGNKYRSVPNDIVMKPLDGVKPYNDYLKAIDDVKESEYLINQYNPINDLYYEISDKQSGINSAKEFLSNHKLKPNEELLFSTISSGTGGLRELMIHDKTTGKVKSYYHDGISYKPSSNTYNINDLVDDAKQPIPTQSEVDLLNKDLYQKVQMFNNDLDFNHPDYSPIHKGEEWDWLYQQQEGR